MTMAGSTNIPIISWLVLFLFFSGLLTQGTITTVSATDTTALTAEVSELKTRLDAMDSKVTKLTKMLRYTRRKLTLAVSELDQLDAQWNAMSGNTSCSCHSTCCTVTTLTRELAGLQQSSAEVERWVEAQRNESGGSADRLQTMYSYLNASLLQLQTQVEQLANGSHVVRSNEEDAITTTSTTPAPTPKHCEQLNPLGTGVRQIWFNSEPKAVYCERDWTVIQKRINGSLDFYREWNDYRNGFGNASAEYWIGLDWLRSVTAEGTWHLQVDLWNWVGGNASALYKGFKVKSLSENFALVLEGFVNGSAGDSLYTTHANMQFSTSDSDNDRYSGSNCAQTFYGAWWYRACLISNLNGKYYNRSSASNDGIVWKSWMGFNYSLKKTVMKIRPVG